MPFKITQDTTLRWLQYRIIHRCIATNELLHKINILDSNLCTFCGEHVESILYLFCNCKHVNYFWNELKLWFLQNFRIHVRVSSLHICLLNNVHENHNIINLIIILAKKHIYKQRLENRKPRIDLFLSEVRRYYLLEKSIYKNNSKSTLFEKKWKAIMPWFKQQAERYWTHFCCMHGVCVS